MDSAPALSPTGTQAHLSPSFWLGLFALMVVAVSVCDYTNPAQIGVLSALTLIALAAVGAPLVRLRRLLPLVSFGIGCYLLLLVVPLQPGQPAVALWGDRLNMPLQGVEFLTAILVKSVLIVLLATALGEQLDMRGLLAGLSDLRLPPMVVSLIYLMVRSVGTLRDEVLRLVRARNARGGASGWRAARVAGAMAHVLLVRIGRRAEWQAFALCSRGYAGRLAITGWRTLSVAELLVLVAAAGALGWLVWIWR